MGLEVSAGSSASVVVRDAPGWGGWQFTVHGDGGIAVTPPNGERIDATTWRRMPIGYVLAQARRAAQADVAEAFLAMIATQAGDANDPKRGRRADREDAIARVYRLAVDWDMSPSEAVADAFGTTEVTARRWIAAIRRTPANPRGILGSFTEEKARIAERDAATRTRRASARAKGNGRSRGRGSIDSSKEQQ